MPPAKETITFNPKTLAVLVGLTISLFGAGFSIYTFGSSYHEQFATSTTVDKQVSDLNKELITFAIQDKEDEIQLIEFKESSGTSDAEDDSRKKTLERRLASLKVKLAAFE